MDRVPQRKYSPRSLEQWFQRLSRPWEEDFSGAELAAAREVYREGEVRSIELADDHAIIHGGRARDDIYAVIDWPEGGKARVRFSVSDARAGRALAAAGLYEIEELVAEEAQALPGPLPEAAPRRVEAELPVPAAASRASLDPGRPLRIELAGTDRGLRLRAHWREEGVGPRNAFRSGRLASGERERLIALTSRARKAGFELRSYSGDYVLRDPERMAVFVRQELPVWRKRFEVEADASVQRLARGVQTAELQLRVERNGRGLKFSWTGRLQGSVVSAELALSLLRQPQEVVIDPRWGLVALAPEQSRWVADWQPVLEGRFEGVLPFYMLFSLRAQEEVPLLLGEELERWREEVEVGSAAESAELPACLRPYQRAGVRWMGHLARAQCHPLLADEMGLGKTLQLLCVLHSDPATRERPSLIVCPASVVPVWEAEVARFFPEMTVRRLQQGNAFDEAPAGVLWLSSYTQLRRHRERLGEREFHYAVLDEAQMIKNPDAKVAQACWAIRASHRLALTGTPIENRPLDVWTLFRFLMPGLLGSRRAFEEAFARDAASATEILRRQLAPFLLRRTKSSVGNELPAKIEMVLPCPLSAVQVAEYRRLVEEGTRELDERTGEALRRKPLPLLSLLTRLRQTCCDPGLLPWRQGDDPALSGKLTTLCERLEVVVENGRKAVIFSQFTRLLDRAERMLGERFPTLPRHRLDGRTVDRARPVKAFQESDGAALMIVSLKAGGTGITLHAADYVFLLDPWWNPAVEAQAIDRVHRIGQTRQVMVYRLVTRGTVEERIEALKESKRAQFEALVGETSGALDWASQFSRLSDLIAYREPA
jgi:superfamily II DNA or RNA helicase